MEIETGHGEADLVSRPRSDHLGTIVSLFLAVTLLVLGVLLGHVKLEDFRNSLAIVFVSSLGLGLPLALAIYLLGRRSSDKTAESLQTITRSANAAISTIAVAVGDSGSFSVVGKPQLKGIESLATEVWTYAYELRMEAAGGALYDVIMRNLRECHRYRYLIPNDEDVVARAREFASRLNHKVENLDQFLEFRVRPNEVAFARYCVSIYNPSYLLPDVQSNDSTVIMFPHLTNPVDAEDYVKIKGPLVHDYEHEFNQIWMSAATRKLPIDVLLSSSPIVLGELS